jgi:alpha-tubulin suppressor-like RCC1 family protein
MPANMSPIFGLTPILGMASLSAANTGRGISAPFNWGENAVGQLGTNSTTSSLNSPVSVVGNFTFVQIGTGGGTKTGRATDGTAWGWGLNAQGRLGDNTATNRSSPVSVVGAHSFGFVNAGNSFSFGIKPDGAIWTWGNDNNGQLGQGTTAVVNRSSPVSVVGGHSFAMASGGLVSVVALKGIDGSAWSWGSNSFGSIGDGTTDARSSPVSTLGGHWFSQVSSANSSAFAIAPNGTAWAWGYNASGQLGDNSTDNRSSPVSVVGGHSFVIIRGTGIGGAVALKADGSAWAWGENSRGHLGDTTTTNRSSPVSVVGGHSFVDAGGGGSWRIGLKSDGSAWTWGVNGSDAGSLADGTLLDRSSPVSVVGGHAFTLISTQDGVSGGGGFALSLGYMPRLFYAGENGALVEGVLIRATGSTTAGMIRLWLNNGTTTLMIREVKVLAITVSASVASFAVTVPLAMSVPPGSSMFASTNNAEGFNVTVYGSHY